MRIFGKGKCKFIANFSATMVTSLPSRYFRLTTSVSLSLSHRLYLTHNIGSASALPIIGSASALPIISKIANTVLEKRQLRGSVPNFKTKALAVRKLKGKEICENERRETASFMYNFV